MGRRQFYSTIKYTDTGEWLEIKSGVGFLGITNKSQEEMGEIVYLDFPNEKQIVKGDIVANIESVKSVQEIKSPISGTITEQNSKVEETPSLLNERPMDSWLCKIQLSNEEELLDLADQ